MSDASIHSQNPIMVPHSTFFERTKVVPGSDSWEFFPKPPIGIPGAGHNSGTQTMEYSNGTIAIFALGLLLLVAGFVLIVVAGFIGNGLFMLGSLTVFLCGAVAFRTALGRNKVPEGAVG